jgi:hypothetical protein
MLPPLKTVAEIDEKELFAASYVKLARAQKFIDDLESELARYIASKPLSARFRHEENPATIHVQWTGITMLPGAIIGDAIHNLRTSLDLMASELARINKKSDSDVYFPFAATADKFEQVINSRNFDRAGEDAVLLLKSFAPYRGGNDRLRALHDLDIEDKHKALVPTGHTMNVKIEGSYNIDNLAENTLSLIGEDIHYTFPPNTVFGGDRIIETLKDLMQIVHGIVEAFAGLVRSRKPIA